MVQIIRPALRSDAAVRELLAEAQAEVKSVREGGYGRTEYAVFYERYLNGIVQTLHWRLGQAPSPIFGKDAFDVDLLGRERNNAWWIIDNDPGALKGYDGEFATAAYRTLAWLEEGHVLVHPLEYV